MTDSEMTGLGEEPGLVGNLSHKLLSNVTAPLLSNVTAPLTADFKRSISFLHFDSRSTLHQIQRQVRAFAFL